MLVLAPYIDGLSEAGLKTVKLQFEETQNETFPCWTINLSTSLDTVARF